MTASRPSARTTPGELSSRPAAAPRGRTRVLFFVQGEGRGHLTQSLALAAILAAGGDAFELAGFVVGRGEGREIPDYFAARAGAPVHRIDSPRLATRTGRSGAEAISIGRTAARVAAAAPRYRQGLAAIDRLLAEVRPDLVVNFLEPMFGLYAMLRRPTVPTVSVGHQFCSLHPCWQAPPGRAFSRAQLRGYALFTSFGAAARLALSFYPMPDHAPRRVTVVPPLLRPGLAALPVRREPFVLAYLLKASYASQVIAWSERHPEQRLECFWDNTDRPNPWSPTPALRFHHLDDRLFLEKMAACSAVATTAGFESVCEAMFLGKPALTVPVAGHYEQLGNALDAQRAGGAVFAGSFELERLLAFAAAYRPDPAFRAWVESAPGRVLAVLARVVEGARRQAGGEDQDRHHEVEQRHLAQHAARPLVPRPHPRGSRRDRQRQADVVVHG